MCTQASTSQVWGRQPGQKGLLAGGTAYYVTDGSQERSGLHHTNLPFPFICFDEIIFLARYQEPFVMHSVNTLLSIYLLSPGSGAASTGRQGSVGPAETAGQELLQKRLCTPGGQAQRCLDQMKQIKNMENLILSWQG